MSDNSEQQNDRLTRLEQELSLVKQGLSLLGLRACSHCGKFFRASNSSLFEGGGEAVCMHCLEHWWPERCETLEVGDREVIERKLVSWLINHRQGKVVQWEKEPQDKQEFRMVANCVQCNGAAAVAGKRCAGCNGHGTVLVVASR